LIIDKFLKQKSEENQSSEVVRTVDLYNGISNNHLKHLFSVLHQKLNQLFKFMYSKTNGHSKAENY